MTVYKTNAIVEEIKTNNSKIPADRIEWATCNGVIYFILYYGDSKVYGERNQYGGGAVTDDNYHNKVMKYHA